MEGAAAGLLLVTVLVGCSTPKAPEATPEPETTEPSAIVVSTTAAPTTTEAPTTTSTTAAPETTTTTVDAATQNFYAKFGGPRADPATTTTVLGPTVVSGTASCRAASLYTFAAHAEVTWSDGFVELIDSPALGQQTKGAATGPRGSKVDLYVTLDGQGLPGACGASWRGPGQP
jgi:cytoskeletal protein RodZ